MTTCVEPSVVVHSTTCLPTLAQTFLLTFGSLAGRSSPLPGTRSKTVSSLLTSATANWKVWFAAFFEVSPPKQRTTSASPSAAPAPSSGPSAMLSGPDGSSPCIRTTGAFGSPSKWKTMKSPRVSLAASLRSSTTPPPDNGTSDWKHPSPSGGTFRPFPIALPLVKSMKRTEPLFNATHAMSSPGKLQTATAVDGKTTSEKSVAAASFFDFAVPGFRREHWSSFGMTLVRQVFSSALRKDTTADDSD
mmetsp:Transcript_28747/g.66770  ORF Transcript_28747/g.66770 Transcript_28747/m.66770 type:complete len:247 (-) Transcript_28747:388-1128(-)